MKCWIVLVALAAAVALEEDDVTEEEADKIAEHHRKCLVSSNVALPEAQKLNEGDWTSTDPVVADFVFCMLQAYGFMDAEARFNKDVFIAKIPPTFDEVDVKNAIEECLTSVEYPGPGPARYAFSLVACYHGKGTGYSLF